MNIIIFGGNGFIGNKLFKSLKKNNKVVIYGNKKYSKVGKNLIFYNKYNFTNIIKKIKPEVIFFLSGNSYPNNTSNDDIYDLKSTNLVLQELLSALKKTQFNKLFFYTSSIAVYGSVKSKKSITENYKLNPESLYGNSKLIAEKQIEYMSKNVLFNSIILRLSSIYGPGLKRQIIYQVIKSILTSNKIILNGKINDKRQFLYVNDCVKILKSLINKKYKKFQIYNISSGKKIEIKKIIKYLEIQLNKKITTKFLNKFKSPNLPELSNKKVLKKIGNVRFTSFNYGLVETLNFIKNSLK
tara:strand:+ start:7786 stop:8679 length:894 start_codon:yes stop_codon:yes gene_type:complete